MELCKNCGDAVPQVYCGTCGQKAHPERITFAFIWHELFHFFTHIKKGFLYTTLRMVRDPGPMVIGYIDGKRRSYQSPVSYFLIWTTVFLLALYGLVKVFGERSVIEYGDYFGPGASTTFAISNLSFVLAFIIPIQALHLHFLVTQRKYNYVESLVILIYGIGTIIFLQFVFALMSLTRYLITGHATNLQYSDILKAGYFFLLITSLMRSFPVSQKFLRGLVLFLLVAGTFTLWRLYVVPVMAKLFVQ